METIIVRTRVDSSMLAAVGYAEERGVLEVEFLSGEIYRFFLVPPTIWDALMTAPSKGEFFNAEIKDRFPFVEVPSESIDLTPPPDTLLADLERSLIQQRERSDGSTAPRSESPESPPHP